MRFLVLGGGAQGSAAAFDLLRQDAVEEVVVADLRPDALHPALRPHLGRRLSMLPADASSSDSIRRAMAGVSGVLCALPYHFNYEMARMAVEAGAHFTDLGGNTAIVTRQRGLDAVARQQGVSVAPDIGLAPGMINILAHAGIERFDEVQAVRLWVGGLPRNPRPPLNYQIVYALEGMFDYYVTPAEILRDGKRVRVEALSELETVEFGAPIGRLEAFHTGGGTSTMPARYEHRIRSFEYKTLRYPGHAQVMRAIRELGLLSDRDVDYNGAIVNPRKFFIQQATPSLRNEDGDDFVVARVEVTGEKDRVRSRIRYEVIDHYDPETGITAMARTTGFTLAIVALMQARGEVVAGVGTPDEVIPSAPYILELAERGIRARFERLPAVSPGNQPPTAESQDTDSRQLRTH